MSRRRKIIYMLIIYTVVFGMLEIMTRIYFHRRDSIRAATVTNNAQSFYESHPFMTYMPNPDHDTHTAGGFRGSETHVHEKTGLRIACLGGSSTYGTQVPEASCYPRRLEAILKERLEADIEVMNLGLAGYSSPNLIAQLALKAVHYEPDFAIFYLGWNDIWNRIFYPGFKTDYSHAVKAWRELEHSWWRRSLFLDKLAILLGSPSARDPHIHKLCWYPRSGSLADNWAASNAEPFAANLKTLIAICREHDITPVFATQAADFEHHGFEKAGEEVWPGAVAEYHDLILSTAEAAGVLCFDLAPLMNDQEEFFADVLHMNELGNQHRAEILAEFLTDRFPDQLHGQTVN